MQQSILKLIVTPSGSCKKTLQFFDDNIAQLRRLGVQLRIEKISKNEFDETIITKLQKIGISRLPALITPSKKIYIGYDEITKVCNEHLHAGATEARIGATGGREPYIGDIGDYWKSALDSGEKESEGSETDLAESNIERRIAAANKRRQQRNTRGGRGEPMTVDDRNSPVRRRRINKEYDSDDDREDAMFDDRDRGHRNKRSGFQFTGGNALDEEKKDNDMINAWLINNIDGTM